jgi:hypothetical protein
LIADFKVGDETLFSFFYHLENRTVFDTRDNQVKSASQMLADAAVWLAQTGDRLAHGRPANPLELQKDSAAARQILRMLCTVCDEEDEKAAFPLISQHSVNSSVRSNAVIFLNHTRKNVTATENRRAVALEGLQVSIGSTRTTTILPNNRIPFDGVRAFGSEIPRSLLEVG